MQQDAHGPEKQDRAKERPTSKPKKSQRTHDVRERNGKGANRNWREAPNEELSEESLSDLDIQFKRVSSPGTDPIWCAARKREDVTTYFLIRHGQLPGNEQEVWACRRFRPLFRDERTRIEFVPVQLLHVVTTVGDQVTERFFSNPEREGKYKSARHAENGLTVIYVPAKSGLRPVDSNSKYRGRIERVIYCNEVGDFRLIAVKLEEELDDKVPGKQE